MKSIEKNFKKEMRKDENLGEYPALVRVVRGKKYTRRTLGKNIYLLGDKDIDASMKKMLVDQLHKASQKDLEECKNEDESYSDDAEREYLSIESLQEKESVIG